MCNKKEKDRIRKEGLECLFSFPQENDIFVSLVKIAMSFTMVAFMITMWPPRACSPSGLFLHTAELLLWLSQNKKNNFSALLHYLGIRPVTLPSKITALYYPEIPDLIQSVLKPQL